MVKEEILNGIRIAVEKGIPLKQAMLSFYKAGYPKKDIEEAGKEFQKRKEEFQKTNTQNNYDLKDKNKQNSVSAKKSNTENQENQQKNLPQKNPSPNPNKNPKQNTQQPPKPKKRIGVSDYDDEKPSSGKYLMVMYIAISILIFIGLISGLLIFKEEILNFFTRILESL